MPDRAWTEFERLEVRDTEESEELTDKVYAGGRRHDDAASPADAFLPNEQQMTAGHYRLFIAQLADKLDEIVLDYMEARPVLMPIEVDLTNTLRELSRLAKGLLK
jgi:hypothetical protein